MTTRPELTAPGGPGRSVGPTGTPQADSAAGISAADAVSRSALRGRREATVGRAGTAGRVVRTTVMGIVNVTPDSFSDGGAWFEHRAAIARGLDLVAHGAAIIDVGGESTRPGAVRPSAEEERRRVVPVITQLAAQGVTVSVDTMRAEVAEAAVEAGATMVNDVSGALADPDMARFVAASGVDFVLMHWRGHSADMQSRAHYRDVVADVRRELAQGLDRVIEAGVDPERVILDPGLGFAKRAEHNWALLRHLDELQSLGCPLLVGTSRKTFLGDVDPDVAGNPAPPAGRDAATTATTVLCAQLGAWGVRVHDVAAAVVALRVVEAFERTP